MISSTQARSARKSNTSISSPALFDTLEGRTMMSAAQPNFANFSSITGLRATGYGDSAVTSKNTLQLTDSGYFEARSVFWTQKVAVDAFTTSFSFVSNKGNTADGLTFTLQNYGTTAHGHSGGNLGYTGPQFDNSVAVAFNLYNNGAYGSQFGFASGGTMPVTNTSMGRVDLHSGDIMKATISYDNTTLSVHVVDTVTGAVFNASEKINLPKALGGSTAFVGFTGASGVQTSTQKITSWTYSGTNTPAVTVHARAVPATTSSKTTLEVRAAELSSDASLTYSWFVVSKPSGAKSPVFKLNGRNASKNCATTFYKAGRYLVRCKITDRFGNTVDSNTVAITVT